MSPFQGVSKRARERGISAWLVTWDWAGEHASRHPRVVAILNPRMSGSRVAEIVERLYSESEYDPSEQIEVLLHPERNPYRAQFGSINGVQWEGQVICGHNPYLFARLVRGLRAVEIDGEEQFAWEEIDRPNLKLHLETKAE